jgi:hypothetical protein
MVFDIYENEEVENISFNEITEEDFTFLLKWLNTDFVKEWYYKYGTNKQVWTFKEIEEKYLPLVNKEKPTDGYIILHQNKKIGYIQTYML